MRRVFLVRSDWGSTGILARDLFEAAAIADRLFPGEKFTIEETSETELDVMSEVRLEAAK